MIKRLTLLAPLAVWLTAAATGGALAAEGRSQPWQMNLQPAYSPVMERIHDFHNLLLFIQVVIVILVLGIMVWVFIKYNAKANPTPSKTVHNTTLEIIWTAVPIVILVVIAVPSMKLLYYADKTHDAEMTLKVVGHQWYWSYGYPDHGDFEFDSFIVADDDLEAGQPRLLTVDNSVVLPVNTNVRVLITTDDVIHNWAIPSLGLKTDATPGRTNETWVRINEEGDYYGMCSELCGVNHGFMPIHVRAVSKEAFAEWVVQAKEEFAQADPEVIVARTDSDMR